jgi:hypothetical protein
MTNSPGAFAAALAIAIAAIPSIAHAQVNQPPLSQPQDAATAPVVPPPSAAILPQDVTAAIPPVRTTTIIQTYTYSPVCWVYRQQFEDEQGWRLRPVRVCY